MFELLCKCRPLKTGSAPRSQLIKYWKDLCCFVARNHASNHFDVVILEKYIFGREPSAVTVTKAVPRIPNAMPLK
jgi:hypothetical protein